MKRLALLLLALVGCPKPDAGAGSISTRWAEARVPEGYVPMDEAELARLRGSMTEGRKSARVELVGRRAEEGVAKGVVYASTSEYPDLEVTRGLSLSMIVQITEQQQLSSAEAKGMAVPGGVQASKDASGKTMTLRLTLQRPEGGTLKQIGQLGLREDGVLLEATCACAGTACAAEPCTVSIPTERLLSVDDRFNPSRSEDELEWIQTRWVSAPAPKTYVPLTLADEQKFSGALRSPGSAFEARKHPLGLDDGLAWVRSFDHPPNDAYGRDLEALVEDLRAGREANEQNVREDQRFSFTVKRRPGDRIIELRASLPEDTPLHSKRRSQFVLLTDGTLREADCYCDAHACDVEQCRFDLGDADRQPIDEPVFPGGPMRPVSVADGAVKFSVPPFLAERESDGAKAAAAVQADPELYGYAQRCFVAPDHLGIACGMERVWCSKGECDPEAVVSYIEDDLRAMAAEHGGSPLTPSFDRGLRVETKPGLYTFRVHELEGRLGSMRRKTVVWRDGAHVRERSCECGGAICEPVWPTCAIAQP